MTIPFAMPDWLPYWVPLLLLLPGLLYALAFLFMPFSVIGVKSRLEVIEARLDELQNEIRHLALRLPAAGRETDYEDVYARPRQPPRRAPDPVMARPPIPPAAYELPDEAPPPMQQEYEDRVPPPAHARPLRRGEPRIGPQPGSPSGSPSGSPRAEPRVNWPR